MEIYIGIRLPENKEYWKNVLQEFADRLDEKKIKEVQFGKQDIRGTESITLIDKRSCVPFQCHFDNKWQMLGFVEGYNEARKGRQHSRFNMFEK